MNNGILMVISYVHARIATISANREEGASAVEYGLLVSLIAGVIVALVAGLGTKLSGVFSTVTGKLV